MELKKIEEAIGKKIVEKTPLGGGCIGQSYLLKDIKGEKYFLKYQQAYAALDFTIESKGLELLRSAKAFPIPKVVAVDQSYLLLEYIEQGSTQDWSTFGRRLSCLHRVRGPHFGLDHDNYIGATPQKNRSEKPREKTDWPCFFWKYRLESLVHMIKQKGCALSKKLELALQEMKEKCFEVMDYAYSDLNAVLTHGDLWSGNILWGSQERGPMLIDPAVSFSHREVDLAMLTLFGSPPPSFWESYEMEAPLIRKGFEQRRGLYQLYHLLNHYYLFGGGYGVQSLQSMRKLRDS